MDMFLAIVTFVAGAYVGYKYPEQVGKVVESTKNLFNTLKDKLTKKEEPPSA
jgi:hypothetical protein